MGFLFILIYLGIVFAVIEINVILFIATGLDHHVARFQVISMLTGTGFTTGESELIIDHPFRRRLGAFLILFGAFSLAVIISAISSLLSDNFFATEIGYIAAALLVITLFMKTPFVKKKLGKHLKGELKKNYNIADLPVSDVILFSEKDEIAELSIPEKSDLAGKTFRKLIEENQDINVLRLSRNSRQPNFYPISLFIHRVNLI
ncbi:hypothetical protein [Bacillus massilinigeriensis]|uniref:hypothetical protein n=1 Tax=Bacillus mediterraneensis TaxID=1805474 RepID=UPI0008F8F1D7|nr:hypothetical protein [Bacillus mediterraneensis]